MSPAPSRQYTATHRAEKRPRRRPSGRALAVAAVGGVLLTGGAVAAQAAVGGSADQASAAAEPALASAPAGDTGVSRSSDRPVLDAIDEATAKAAAQATRAAKEHAAEEKERKKKAAAEAAAQAAIDDARNDPKGAAQAMLADHGWDASQFSCLDSLWAGESGWNYQATNPSSGAYGIPQSLPADKMATAGADWKTNPVTQIAWGLDYIERTYGSPCSAQSFKSGHGWY